MTNREKEVPWTPGPWRVYLADDGIHSIGIGTSATGEGVLDAGFGVWRDGPEAAANARLAAEAPAMAELLAKGHSDYPAGDPLIVASGLASKAGDHVLAIFLQDKYNAERELLSRLRTPQTEGGSV